MKTCLPPACNANINITNDVVEGVTDENKYDDINICTCIKGECFLKRLCNTNDTVIAHHNIRSLLPKIDQIRCLLKEHLLISYA